MGKIQDMINKLTKQGTVAAQEKALLQIIRDNQAQAVDLNLEQLFQGKDSSGKEITPEYTPFTKMIKRAKGQPSDRVTLKDEGDFYQSWKLLADKFPVMFDASDLKAPKLFEKYGDDTKGLDQKNKTVFVQEIKPEVQGYYRSLVHV